MRTSWQKVFNLFYLMLHECTHTHRQSLRAAATKMPINCASQANKNLLHTFEGARASLAAELGRIYLFTASWRISRWADNNFDMRKQAGEMTGYYSIEFVYMHQTTR